MCIDAVFNMIPAHCFKFILVFTIELMTIGVTLQLY